MWDWGKFASAVTSLTAVAALLFTTLSLQQTRAQNELAEAGQITDRFNAAVTNLGSTTETIRIGGVYALQRIMQDSPRDQPAAVQVLSAFVREHAPPAPAPTPAPTPTPTPTAGTTWAETATLKPAIDVQTALTVLANRDPSHDHGVGIDLDHANLAGVNLAGANLSTANLAGTNFTSADLGNADLRSADLSNADLSGARLDSVDLVDASLRGADLSHVNLDGSNLTGVMAIGADLDHTQLEDTTVAGAALMFSDLSGAVLSGTDLSGTSLYGAYASDLIMGPVNLHGAVLSTRILCSPHNQPDYVSMGYRCVPPPSVQGPDGAQAMQSAGK